MIKLRVDTYSPQTQRETYDIVSCSNPCFMYELTSVSYYECIIILLDVELWRVGDFLQAILYIDKPVSNREKIYIQFYLSASHLYIITARFFMKFILNPFTCSLLYYSSF